MKIEIKATGIELSDNLKNYIEEKIGSCEKFLSLRNYPLNAFVEIEKTTKHHKKGLVFRAEVNLEVPGKLIRVESTKEDLYQAIVEAKDKLQRVLKKYKNRVKK